MGGFGRSRWRPGGEDDDDNDYVGMIITSVYKMPISGEFLKVFWGVFHHFWE